MSTTLLDETTKIRGNNGFIQWDWLKRSHLLRELVRMVRRVQRTTRSKRKGKTGYTTSQIFRIVGGLLLVVVGICVFLWGLKDDSDKSVLDEVERGWFLMGRQVRYEDGVKRCSWMYLDVGQEDGEGVVEFSKGGGVLEEFLRAEQSKARAFCVTIVGGKEKYDGVLMSVRRKIGHHFKAFNVYMGLSIGDTDDKFVESEKNEGGSRKRTKRKTVYLPKLVQSLTYERKDSGRDSRGMVLALSNRNNGTSIVRISASVSDVYRMLEDLAKSEVLCSRIDRLVLNIVDDTPDTYAHMRTRPTTDDTWNPSNGLSGLVNLAKGFNEPEKRCRAMVYVLNNRKRLVPTPLTDSEVFYAVLAGEPTFDRRVGAQTATWMKDVPRNRLALFTNVERTGEQRKAAQGFDINLVQSNNMTMEQWPERMQSWSHLVRMRKAWDDYLSKDKNIKWLVLVDDDTFVFTRAFREYLTGLDHRVLQWGGSAEQARVDNGDTGIFAHWLRNASQVYGGKYCYMRNENPPAGLRLPKLVYKKSDSAKNMIMVKKESVWCHDTFCRKGCPAVPQGAAIFVSRPVVEQLRPHVEKCERLTHTLCKSCGSQRLYMCIHLILKDTRTMMARGICRSTWKMEHRKQFPFALTYHGFERYRGRAFHRGSILNDMLELYEIGKQEDERNRKLGRPDVVRLQVIANKIGCDGEAHYNMEENKCIPTRSTEE